MPYFNTKPSLVEAKYFSSAVEANSLADWCGGRTFHDPYSGMRIEIPTSAGPLFACVGQWIVKEVSGGVSVMERDKFNSKYVLANNLKMGGLG